MAPKRASGRREYCLIHQEDRPKTHPIGHVIALKHGGRTEERNLALACASCNNNKGADLAALDPSSGEIPEHDGRLRPCRKLAVACRDSRYVPCRQRFVSLLSMSLIPRSGSLGGAGKGEY